MKKPQEERDFQRHLEAIFQELPENVRIIEKGVDPQVMMEYEQIAQNLRQEQQSEEKDQALAQELADFNPWQILSFLDKASDTLKRTIVQLGETGTVENYRRLEEMEKEMADNAQWSPWFHIARIQCQLHLENSLLDEPVGFIATGMGGQGKCIRYVLLLRHEQNQHPLEPAQASLARQEVEELIQKAGGTIEEVRTESMYIYFQMLFPLKSSLLQLVQEAVDRCDFISEDFWISNIQIPSQEQIDEWLAGKDEDATPDDLTDLSNLSLS